MKPILRKPVTRQKSNPWLMVAWCAVFLWPIACVQAQRLPVNHEVQPYNLHTGVYTNSSTNEFVAFRTSIKAANEPSKLRIHFNAFQLGKRSYLTVSSARDGGKQKLDHISIGYWQSNSAIFNGDTVNLELTIAPGEQGVFAQV